MSQLPDNIRNIINDFERKGILHFKGKLSQDIINERKELQKWKKKPELLSPEENIQINALIEITMKSSILHNSPSSDDWFSFVREIIT
jgi:hypothetical protein